MLLFIAEKWLEKYIFIKNETVAHATFHWIKIPEKNTHIKNI
jgi:hypothetical protein